VTVFLPRELTAFVHVGTAAFAVHFGVVSVIVPLGVPPLGANVLGFLAAFAVSFLGHDRWSFPAAQPRSWAALRRFFAVALLGFAVNETLYAVLLSSTHLDYRVALLFVLAVVAVSTLLLSKYWAFADER
jgi:putative flippase GtrA